MLAVRIAMCTPSRSDQIATKAATSHCRAFGAAPPTGHSALAAPTSPTANVQMVSTQPELPVRCCTIQAPAIRIDSDTAIAASASRYKIVMQKPVNRCGVKDLSKYASDSKPGFTPKFPVPAPTGAQPAFFPVPLCHIGARKRFSRNG